MKTTTENKLFKNDRTIIEWINDAPWISNGHWAVKLNPADLSAERSALVAQCPKNKSYRTYIGGGQYSVAEPCIAQIIPSLETHELTKTNDLRDLGNVRGGKRRYARFLSNSTFRSMVSEDYLSLIEDVVGDGYVAYAENQHTTVAFYIDGSVAAVVMPMRQD